MQPRIYQKVGARFLSSRFGAILGDKVGTGKSLTSILATKEVGAKQVLVIMPKNLKLQFGNEIIKVLGYGELNESTWQVIAGDCTYQLAHYEQFNAMGIGKHDFLDQTWDVLLCDESHKLKNRDSQRSSNIAKIKSTYVWLMSGTTVAERPDDLWHLLHLLNPTKFRSYWGFVSTYCEVDKGKIVGIRFVKDPTTGRFTQEPVLKMLREQLAPYLLARSLEDVGLELPPMTVVDVSLTMDDDQEKFYQQVKKQVIVELTEAGITDPDVIDLSTTDKLIITTAGARFTRVHQVLSNPRTFKSGVSNTKLAWLRNYVEGGGEPAIIFTRYLDSVKVIKDELDRLGVAGYNVTTYASGSTGHNWQAWHNIICWDLDFSRLVIEQSYGRAHRSGQTKPVQVYRLIAGDADRRVAQLIDRKETVVQLIVSWLRGIMG